LKRFDVRRGEAPMGTGERQAVAWVQLDVLKVEMRSEGQIGTRSRPSCLQAKTCRTDEKRTNAETKGRDDDDLRCHAHPPSPSRVPLGRTSRRETSCGMGLPSRTGPPADPGEAAGQRASRRLREVRLA